MDQRSWSFILWGEAQRLDEPREPMPREPEPERKIVWREALARLEDVWPRRRAEN
jgi:hypothetical protein